MSNALDDLIQTLMRIINLEVLSTRNKDGWGVHNAADAIIAALPGMVKPLEWVKAQINYHRSDPLNGAIRYTVRESINQPGAWHWYLNGTRDSTPFPSLEAAKAAAQAHYTAQIMAAFGIDAAAMKEGKE